MNAEEQNMIEVIKAARTIQEFLWSEMNKSCGLEEFKRMLRKRLSKIEEIKISNPHWKIELKKRLLQIAAISVNLITKLDNNELNYKGIHPKLPSNLPEFDKPIKQPMMKYNEYCEDCEIAIETLDGGSDPIEAYEEGFHLCGKKKPRVKIRNQK